MRQRPRIAVMIAAAITLVGSVAHRASAQQQGAARLQQLVSGLTVTPRVLFIGAHPDDDDPALIAWLARGHMVETGFLSLTRGENGSNFLSGDVGDFLGAIRTSESIAARGVDGGHQFFTRAYDFGFARTAADAFKQWPRDSVLGDVVTVIRSFRPQILIVAFTDSISDGNGQHEAAIELARDAFAVAGDSVRFPAAVYGAPWQPIKLYRHGGPLRIDASGYDPVLGKSYVDLAVESRAQHRSQGLLRSQLAVSPIVLLDRVASRVAEPAVERSIFDGIDTTFARLVVGSTTDDATAMREIGTDADSLRKALDLTHPAGVVRLLVQAVRLSDDLRRSLAWCKRPETVTPAAASARLCTPDALDRDASIDIVRQRAAEALLIAAGVDVRATADQELIALGDTVVVTIALRNRGHAPVTLGDVFVNGVFNAPTKSVVVPPDSVGRAFAIVSELPDARPWWFSPRPDGLFAAANVSVDGLTRSSTIPTLFTIPGVAMPEEMRRVSDATVTVIIDSVPVTISAGPIAFRYANPLMGVQNRPVSGAPAVALSFPRGLEWVVAKKRIDRTERLSIESFSNQSKRFRLQIVLPRGLHLDSAPESITVGPRQRRELSLHVQGMLDSGRVPFGAVGRGSGEPYAGLYIEGVQAVEYPHIPPIRVFRSSGFWFQTVDVMVPPHLAVAYVSGPGDDIALALRDIGMTVATLSPEDLPATDLSYFKTLIIGPRAFDAYPALAAQQTLVLDFARRGGTVVMLQQESPMAGAPFPMGMSFPGVRVTSPGAPVTVLDAGARLLNWPNRIGNADWQGWVDERAAFVPTSVDRRYTSYLEVHDPRQPANESTLISTPVGTGVFVYTTLSLQQQITMGVSGALRLLVNMICAGLPGSPHP